VDLPGVFLDCWSGKYIELSGREVRRCGRALPDFLRRLCAAPSSARAPGELDLDRRRYNFAMKVQADASYKQLFAHPELVRDLLRGFVPYAWADQLEVSAFERVNGSYAG
jgi:hypothetical protein